MITRIYEPSRRRALFDPRSYHRRCTGRHLVTDIRLFATGNAVERVPLLAGLCSPAQPRSRCSLPAGGQNNNFGIYETHRGVAGCSSLSVRLLPGVNPATPAFRLPGPSEGCLHDAL